jgi:hypothetical protein
MSCPADWRLAAAASDADDEAAAHAEACDRCHALVAEQRATAGLARRLPVPSLSPSVREELAVAVTAGTVPSPGGRRAYAVVGGTVVLAAALALVVRGQQPPIEPPAQDEARIGASATSTPGPAVSITSGRAEVLAHDGVIVETHVLAGSAVVTDSGHRVVVNAGHVWKRETARPPEPPPPEPATSLAAFREGWAARDAGRDADAVAAFDRATDPVVAEEAKFWAAICAGRAGHREDSARRLRAFLEEYPSSTRAGDARNALDAP